MTTAPPTGRDPFVDLVRAAALVVVCVWHWAFTILIWGPDGPSPSNPIGYTDAPLWLATWALQVMGLFFFAGGWANISAWNAARDRGVTGAGFVAQRVRQLSLPALALVAVWWGIGIALGAVYDVAWLGRVVILILSPLWFVAVYLAIIVAMPLWAWLHRRFGVLVPVWLAGAVALVDVARFAHGWEWVGWLNMLFAWGFAHQLGFWYADLTRLDRQKATAVSLAGLFGLVGLVWAGLYPASMVGVPGDRFSNLSPPSLAVVFLVVFQVGLLMRIRPWVLARIGRPRWVWFRRQLSLYSLPLYLLHTTGMAVALFVWWLVTGQRADAMQISPEWWLTRPLAVAVPLLFTLPLLWLYGRLTSPRRAAKPA